MDTLTKENRSKVVDLSNQLVDGLPEGIGAVVIGFSDDGEHIMYLSTAKMAILRKIMTDTYVAVHHDHPAVNKPVTTYVS